MNENRLSHAYILAGPEGEAMESAAVRLAAELLCPSPDAPCGRCRDCRKVFSSVHPDVIRVVRGTDDKGRLRREITVDQVRAMTADACVMPNEASRKVYIIREADKMNAAAQNALLKSLEEPPGHAAFLLCAASTDALLETVRSRCVRLTVAREAAGAGNAVSAEAAGEYLRLAAAKNEAEVFRFCMDHAKEDGEWLLSFTDSLRERVCRVLSGEEANPGCSVAWLRELSDFTLRMEDFSRRNIGVKQIMGLLAVQKIKENI